MPFSLDFSKCALVPISTIALAIALPPNASADNLQVTYYSAGVQTSPASTFAETFDSAHPSAGVLTTTFNNSPITGTYTGAFSLSNANVYGGAGGMGSFITTGSTYTLNLSGNVNYFGLWFSALDQGNQLSFYNGASLIYSFTPNAFSALVGACPGNSGFCGNPNANQAGNSGQQYAFLNFYDPGSTFNRIAFTENPAIGGFESDNHTVGNLTSGPGGTVISGVTPEPSTLLLLSTGMACLLIITRRGLKAH